MLEIYDAAQMNTANVVRVKLLFLKTLKMDVTVEELQAVALGGFGSAGLSA